MERGTVTLREEVKHVVGESFTWLRRRSTLLLIAFFGYIMTPLVLFKGLLKRYRGLGYFADEVDHHSYWMFVRGTIARLNSVLLLTEKTPTQEALMALQNTSRVGGDGITVKIMDDHLRFEPTSLPPNVEGKDLTGVIVIPAAFVSPLAYAPLARMLADRGHPTFILRLPLNIAFFGLEAAAKIMAHADQVKPTAPAAWVVMGHSAGGKGMEKFTKAHLGEVRGIVYVGCGPGNSTGELRGLDLPSLVILGSRDHFIRLEDMEVEKHMAKMPKSPEFIVVEGGNHRGFASYTGEPLDWEATITEQEQHLAVVDAVRSFIDRKVLCKD